jgi:hypothetical protein
MFTFYLKLTVPLCYDRSILVPLEKIQKSTIIKLYMANPDKAVSMRASVKDVDFRVPEQWLSVVRGVFPTAFGITGREQLAGFIPMCLRVDQAEGASNDAALRRYQETFKLWESLIERLEEAERVGLHAFDSMMPEIAELLITPEFHKDRRTGGDLAVVRADRVEIPGFYDRVQTPLEQLGFSIATWVHVNDSKGNPYKMTATFKKPL